MRINEYQKLEDFINEYDGKMEVGNEFHMGIEFKYKDVMYRMCREPIGHYYLYKIIKPLSDEIEFETIGIYETMEELLETTVIEDTTFKNIIIGDETFIDSKD